MDHIGIDIGGKESQICVRDAGGQIIEEKRIKTQSLGAYLSKKPAARVVLETCANRGEMPGVCLIGDPRGK